MMPPTTTTITTTTATNFGVNFFGGQQNNRYTATAVATPPFGFPFNPLTLGLFEADPSRLLSILHHQTLLAEEALR